MPTFCRPNRRPELGSSIRAVTIALSAFLGSCSGPGRLEQIYYLGAFDPLEQVPPTVYRITVNAYADPVSTVRYASGWVPADLIDSLGSRVKLDQESGDIEVTGGDQLSRLQTGRRLIQFGPEGFREAPAHHRLVIVMGTSPEKFFQAIDQSLGVVTEVNEERKSSSIAQSLFEEMSRIREEQLAMQKLASEVELERQIEELR